MERLTINELIAHCDRKLDRLPSGNIMYQEHESVRAYLQILRHYVDAGTSSEFRTLKEAEQKRRDGCDWEERAMTEMTTDALELYCRNLSKAKNDLTEYDRALLIDVAARLCELQCRTAADDITTLTRPMDGGGCMDKSISVTTRLIDAESVDYLLFKHQEVSKNGNRQYAHGFRDARKIISEQPTIDAVPVVRCGECISFVAGDGDFEMDGFCRNSLACRYVMARKRDSFCSYGEKREEAQQCGAK